MNPLVLEQLPQKRQGNVPIAKLLDQHVEDFALIVHGTPKAHLFPAAPDIHFVQVPTARFGETPAPAKVRGGLRAELAPLGQQFFDVSEAQREAVVEPDAMANDVSGKRGFK